MLDEIERERNSFNDWFYSSKSGGMVFLRYEG